MKKSQSSKEAVIGANLWTCLTCKDAESGTHEEILTHLKGKHGIDPKGKKANRRMIMHMDGADFFISQYHWNIEGIEIDNFVKCAREKDDPMGDME